MYFRTQLLILYQNHSVCPFLGKFLSKVPLYFFITSHLLAKKKTTNNQLTGWSGRTFHLIWSDKRVFIVYDNPTQTLYLIMQHLCESTSCQLFHPQHSRCTICVSFQYFLQIHPKECRSNHYSCLHGVPLTIFTTEHPNFDYCFLFQVYSSTTLAVTTPLSICLAVWSLCLASCVTPSRGSMRGKCKNQGVEQNRTSEWTVHSGAGLEMTLSIGEF